MTLFWPELPYQRQCLYTCYESVGFVVTGIDTYAIDGEEWTGKEMELVIKNSL